METVLEIINIIGIISFAAAGAMISIDAEADLFGVIFLSLITCFGGGLLRDIIAGQTIGRELPLLFTDMNTEIIVCICTATLVFLLAFIFKKKYVEEERTVDRINNVLDALGLGIFASAGVGAYFAGGPLVAITMGVLSSVGGSVTRDVILGDIPPILRKHVYALASTAGSAAYYLTAMLIDPANESRDVIATLACTAVIFSIRMLATVFRWDLPKAIDFSKIRYDNDSSDERDTEPAIKK